MDNQVNSSLYPGRTLAGAAGLGFYANTLYIAI